MRHIVTFLGTLLLFKSLPAQDFELGIYGGLSFYEGELAPLEVPVYIETLRPAYGFFGRLHVRNYLAFRGGYDRLRLIGDDEIRGTPLGRNFDTEVNEVHFQMEITPFYVSLFNRSINVAPYGYGGGAFFTFTPTAKVNGQRVELQPLGTEAQGQPGYPAPYDLQGFALLAGGGVKWRISDQWTLAAEYGARKTFTDFLDDRSGNRITYSDVLKNGPLAAEISAPYLNPDTTDPNYRYRRGGPRPDWYFTGGLTLSFVFGYGQERIGEGGRGKMLKCYKF